MKNNLTREEKEQLWSHIYNIYRKAGNFRERIDEPTSDLLVDNTLINIDILIEYLREIANKRSLECRVKSSRDNVNILWEIGVLLSGNKND